MEQEIEYVIHQTLTLTDADTADEAKGIVTKVETDVSYCGAHLLRIVDDRHPFRTLDVLSNRLQAAINPDSQKEGDETCYCYNCADDCGYVRGFFKKALAWLFLRLVVGRTSRNAKLNALLFQLNDKVRVSRLIRQS